MHLDCHLKWLVGTAEVEPDVRPAIWGPIFPLLLGLLSENKTLFFEADVESIENRSVPIFKASSAVVGESSCPSGCSALESATNRL
jgi:hypothetical protein